MGSDTAMRLTGWLLCCSLVIAVCGCGGSQDKAASTGGETAPAGGAIDLGDPGPPPDGQTEPASEVTLQVLDWSGVEGLIAAHRGQVVVVDFWSTACDPCRREFPELVKLHRDLGAKVACISVSADYDGIPSKPVETYQPDVLAFLQSQEATFENVLCSLPPDELYDTLQFASIPAVFVYDQSGKLAQRFTDPVDGKEFTYAGQIRPYVEGLLSQSDP